MRAVRDDLWMVATSEAMRLGVRVVVTRHLLCGMERYDARLLRRSPARGGGLALLVWGGLTADEQAAAALQALATVSQAAWRAWSARRRVGA